MKQTHEHENGLMVTEDRHGCRVPSWERWEGWTIKYKRLS